MSSSYLITRPDHDDTTRYLFFWAEKIIKKAGTLKKKIVDLSGKKASPAQFLKALRKIKPHFLFLNGHGNEDVVTGFNNVPLVEKDRNENLLKNRRGKNPKIISKRLSENSSQPRPPKPNRKQFTTFNGTKTTKSA